MQSPYTNKQPTNPKYSLRKLTSTARAVQKLALRTLLAKKMKIANPVLTKRKRKISKSRRLRPTTARSLVYGQKLVPFELQSILNDVCDIENVPVDGITEDRPFFIQKSRRSWFKHITSLNARRNSVLNTLLTGVYANAFLHTLITNIVEVFQTSHDPRTADALFQMMEREDEQGRMDKIRWFERTRLDDNAFNQTTATQGPSLFGFLKTVLDSVWKFGVTDNASHTIARHWRKEALEVQENLKGHIALLKSLLAINRPVSIQRLHERLLALIIQHAIIQIGEAIAKKCRNELHFYTRASTVFEDLKRFTDRKPKVSDNSVPTKPKRRASKKNGSSKKASSEKPKESRAILATKILDGFVLRENGEEFLLFIAALDGDQSKIKLSSNWIDHEDYGRINISWLFNASKSISSEDYTGPYVQRRANGELHERRVKMPEVLLEYFQRGVLLPKPTSEITRKEVPFDQFWLLNELLFCTEKAARPIVRMAKNLSIIRLHHNSKYGHRVVFNDTYRVMLSKVLQIAPPKSFEADAKDDEAYENFVLSELSKLMEIGSEGDEKQFPALKKLKDEFVQSGEQQRLQKMWAEFPTSPEYSELPAAAFLVFRAKTHAKRDSALKQFFVSDIAAIYWSDEFRVFVEREERKKPLKYKSKYLERFLNPKKGPSAKPPRSSPSLAPNIQEVTEVFEPKKPFPQLIAEKFDDPDLFKITNAIKNFLIAESLSLDDFKRNGKDWLRLPDLHGLIVDALSVISDPYYSRIDAQNLGSKYSKQRKRAVIKEIKERFRTALKTGQMGAETYSADHLLNLIEEAFHGYKVNVFDFLSEFGALFNQQHVKELIERFQSQMMTGMNAKQIYQAKLDISGLIEDLQEQHLRIKRQAQK